MELVFGVAGGIEKDVEAGAMVAGFGAVATTPFARGRTGLAAAGTFLRVAGRAGATAGLVAVAFMAAGLVAEDLEAMVSGVIFRVFGLVIFILISVFLGVARGPVRQNGFHLPYEESPLIVMKLLDSISSVKN